MFLSLIAFLSHIKTIPAMNDTAKSRCDKNRTFFVKIFRRKNSKLEVTSDVHVLYRRKSLIRLEIVSYHHVLTISEMCERLEPTIFVRLYLIVIKTCSDGFSDGVSDKLFYKVDIMRKPL